MFLLISHVLLVYGVATVVRIYFAAIGENAFIGYPGREWIRFLGLAIGPGSFGHTLTS